MIKKLLSLFMSCAIFFSLTACKNQINIDNNANIEKSRSTYIVDISDLETLGKKYVDFVYTGGTALYKSWNTPNEIDPYNLFISFCYDDTKKIKSSEKIFNVANNGFYYTIDTVYERLSTYFDFDKEILKNSQCYDNEIGMLYHQGLGGGSGIKYTITNIKQTDDILEINYNVDSYDDTIHVSGTLKIKIIDEDNFKYLSYHVENNLDYIKQK